MDAELLARIIGGLFRLSNGVASWLLTYALHSTAWILAAWFLTARRVLRHAPGAQHAAWSASLAAGFLTATLQLTGAVTPVTGSLRVAEEARQTLAAVVVNQGGAAGQAPRLRLAALRSARFPRSAAIPAPAAGDRIYRFAAGSPPDVVPFTLVSTRVSSGVSSGVSSRASSVVSPVHAPQPSTLLTVARTAVSSRPRVPLHPTASSPFRTMVIAPPPSLFALLPWLLVAAALLARLAWAHGALRRVLGDRRNAGASPAGVALRHLCRTAGVRRDVALAVTDGLAAPAAVSTHEIALPSRLLAELTPLEQEGVLAHELAHVVRRDTLWLRLALIIECIAWFQPLNRFARRRMQLAAEFAADAWAVRVTREPLGLARSLARIAEWVVTPSASPLHAALGADGSPLLQRVRRLTAPRVATTGNMGGGRTAALLFAATAAALSITLPSIAVGRAKAPATLGVREEVRVLVRTAAWSAPRGGVAPIAMERVVRLN